jgi:hypothetical protein
MIHYLNPTFNHYPEMLEVIQKIYAPGVDHHAAYTQRNAITESKILAMMREEQTAWTALMEDMQLVYPNSLDMSYERFPNYRLRISMPARQDGMVRRHREFHVVVSLLADFYTCFWEDRYEMLEFRDEKALVSPGIICTVFSDLIRKYPDCLAMMKTAELLLARHFPAHRYVNHYGLFTSDADCNAALPGSDKEQPPYKYFTYLFDDSISLWNRVIWW